MDKELYGEFIEDILVESDSESIFFQKYKIRSMEEFLRLIFVHRKILEEKDIFYRGQGNKEWELEASIFRKNVLNNEDEVMHNLLKIRPYEFKNCKADIEILTVMQHYGSPTRLLDITSNPLIALYFACEEMDENNDGIVHVFEEEFRENRDYINIMSSFAFFESGRTVNEFQKHLNNSGYQYEVSEIQGALNKKRTLIKPKKNNERIIAQQGNFFIFSNNSASGELEHIHKKSFSIEGDKVILINKGSKKTILEQLEVIGLKRSIIYPELVNHVDELISKYKKQEKVNNDNEKKIESKTKDSDLGTSIEYSDEWLEKKGIVLNYKELMTEIRPIISSPDWINFESQKSKVRSKIKRFCRKKNLGEDEVNNIFDILSLPDEE